MQNLYFLLLYRKLKKYMFNLFIKKISVFYGISCGSYFFVTQDVDTHYNMYEFK